MKADIFGVLAAMCLILGGCAAQRNTDGQNTEQIMTADGSENVTPVL